MTTLILHHYPMSPFSEKMRAMLGYAGLEWQSCLTREMPPRPLLERLTGGYRKIPVAQLGADIFCDTHLIAAEVATLSGKTALDLATRSAEEQAFVAHTDLQVFFACLFAAGTPALGRKVWKSMSLRDIALFARDRFQMGRTAQMPGINPLRARAQIRRHLQDLEQRLQYQDFLFGDTPSHADFSVFHSLWFLVDLGESSLVANSPRTLAWLQRLRDFGHGRYREIGSREALAAAHATPRLLADDWRNDALIGQQVAVAPADYGCDASTGTLVAVSPVRWVIARTDAELGTLHVHFPRQGFALRRVG